MRVLIVDDEPPMRRLFKTWVESEGASSFDAASAEEALDLLDSEGTPAVALCDVRLPGNDGLWLAEQLHARSPQTAVVMTTGVNQFDAAISSLHAGVIDYLVKPFTRERMSEALKRAFLTHQSRRALAGMQKELEERRAQIMDAIGELELNATSSLEAMLAMLRVRDSNACDHSHRVSKLALDLAMTLQIGEPRLSDIERAALLHDIGRLAMPDDLLARAAAGAPLSAADRARLQSYPLHGYAMLKNVPFLAAANQIAVAAHERADGSGFPYGLKGEYIPLGARIVAVADAYDELVTGVGCEAVTPARAAEILSTERASKFDTLVLGALTMLQPGTPARVAAA